MGCGCNQQTTTTTCNDCCTNTDPCVTQPCGCEVELDAACIRYTGETLSCSNIEKGSTLETALQNIEEKICGFSGTYIEVTNEVAGVNCANGGIKVQVFDSESSTLLSTEYICNGADGVDGVDGVDGQSIDHSAFTSSSLGGVAGQAGAVDTYTIWGDLAETINLGTFTTYNGTNGTNGLDGVDATPKNRIIASYMDIYTDTGVGVNGVNFTITVADIPLDGDGVHITYVTKQLSGNAGNTELVLTGSGGPATIFTHTFGGIEDETLIIDSYLIRDGLTFKACTRVYGVDGLGVPIIKTNRTTTIIALSNPTVTLSTVLSGATSTSTVEDIVLTILKQ